MFSDFKVSPRLPVLVRVFTDAGEIIEHFARSVKAANGFISYHVQEGYWFGKPVRVEYEYHNKYRG